MSPKIRDIYIKTDGSSKNEDISYRGEEGQIAKTVLMPGDPMRAKYIAEHYLTDVICYSQVQWDDGYTGYYNGKKVSVQGSGMGIPVYGHLFLRTV